MQSVRKRLQFWKAVQSVFFVLIFLVALQHFPYQGIVVVGLGLAFYAAFSIYMDIRCAMCSNHVLPTAGWEMRKAYNIPEHCPHCGVDLRATGG